MDALSITAVATVAAFGLGGWAGIEWQQGRQASAELAERQRQDTRTVLAFSAEAERLDAQADTIALSRQLEDAAYAQPVANPVCLPVERVLRLDQRGRAAP